MFGYRIYNGSSWEWRTLGVVKPGSGGPWEWRTLGIVNPGSDGPKPLLKVLDTSRSGQIMFVHFYYLSNSVDLVTRPCHLGLVTLPGGPGHRALPRFPNGQSATV